MTVDQFYPLYRESKKITTDSRAAQPGSLFFALKGESFDGNRFAGDALDRGCRMAVVDDPSLAADKRFWLVPDVLKFLQALGAYHRRVLGIPVIALTGTNGKTTTKELIHMVLKQQFNVVATEGNLNNHIGVPLTLLKADENTEILVVEMGANHIGEIANLCEIADPTHGLITNIGRAHLEGFGSFNGVIRAKSELYQYLQAKRGRIYQHGDDDLLKGLTANYPVFSYGTGGDCQVLATLTESRRNLNFSFAAPHSKGPVKKPVRIHSQVTGNYNLQNFLAAISVGLDFGIPPIRIKQGLEAYRPQNMRSEWRETGRNEVLLDAYNANPSSMELALAHFDSLPQSRKIVILGDMFELGNEASTEHARVIGKIDQMKFERVYLAGKEFMNLKNDRYRFFESTESLASHLEKESLNGFVILIKGSRGMRLESLVSRL